MTPLSISPHVDLFAAAVSAWKLPPVLAAVVLIQLPKRVAGKLGRKVVMSAPFLRELLLALRDRLLAPEGVLPAMEAWAAGVPFSREALPPQCTEQELGPILEQAIRDAGTVRKPAMAGKLYMGLVMSKVRGRIEGSTVARCLQGAAAEEKR